LSPRIQIQIVILLFLAVSCRRPEPSPKAGFFYSRNVGVAVTKSGKMCLEIHNSSLAPDSRVRLVFTSMPQSTSEAQIIRRADDACPSIDASDPDLHSYEIRLAKDGVESSLPAIAIAGFFGPFAKINDRIVADIDGDGQQQFFRSCTSTEGIHFTVWSGSPLQGKLRWHQYYYLGYDVTAACTPMDLQPVRE